jgi:hypothetical protein
MCDSISTKLVLMKGGKAQHLKNKIALIEKYYLQEHSKSFEELLTLWSSLCFQYATYTVKESD